VQQPIKRVGRQTPDQQQQRSRTLPASICVSHVGVELFQLLATATLPIPADQQLQGGPEK